MKMEKLSWCLYNREVRSSMLMWSLFFRIWSLTFQFRYWDFFPRSDHIVWGVWKLTLTNQILNWCVYQMSVCCLIMDERHFQWPKYSGWPSTVPFSKMKEFGSLKLESENGIFFFFFLGLQVWHVEVPRGQIGAIAAMPQPQKLGIQAASVIYTTAHGNAVSLAHWVRPGIEPASSWQLVTFVSATPQQELQKMEILMDGSSTLWKGLISY